VLKASTRRTGKFFMALSYRREVPRAIRWRELRSA
jgi:hypothetical protein